MGRSRGRQEDGGHGARTPYRLLAPDLAELTDEGMEVTRLADGRVEVHGWWRRLGGRGPDSGFFLGLVVGFLLGAALVLGIVLILTRTLHINLGTGA